MKPKAHKLPESTRAAIAKEYLKAKDAGKSVSYISMATRHNCTPDQVRAAVADYKAGRFAGKLGKRLRGTVAGTVTPTESDVIANLKRQAAVASTELDEVRLDPVERVMMVQKLVTIEQNIQKMELQGHLRRFDSKVFETLVQYFMPEATQQDVSRIYEEVLALCRPSH